MTTSLVIRGTGLITPLGGSVDATWAALLAGRFIDDHARSELRNVAIRPGVPAASRVEHLARLATEDAVNYCHKSSSRNHLSPDRTALVVGTSRGPVDSWLERSEATEGPGFGLSSLADRLAQVFGHGNGPRLTFCGACASGLHALIRAALLLQHGDADRALIVAAESSLHPVFLQSFRRLGVVAPPGDRCRPFDVDRQGLLLCEAAAAVVLERVETPDVGDLVLDGFGFAGDASHLTGFAPEGTTIRRMLATAVGSNPVDVVHAHGTGTVDNDAAEVAAVDAVFAGRTGASRPSLYSHKAALGHSLGASGLVSVVLNARMHQEGVVPPNVGVRTAMPVRHATISRDAVRRPVRRSAVCAAGFGGATAAVSLVTALSEAGSDGSTTANR